MEFSKPGDRQQVKLDTEQFPDGFEDNPAFAFRLGRVSFDNELNNAVAMGHGINADGELDMQMLTAVEQATEYLSNKQGQAFILFDVARNPENGQVVSIQGPVGVVGSSVDPVGIHQGESSMSAGIAVVDGYTDLRGGYREGAYRSMRLTSMGHNIVPFTELYRKVGHPGYEDNRVELEFSQHLVAGEDIAPWIEETFSHIDGYYLYMDIARSVVRHGGEFAESAISSIYSLPYADMATIELEALDKVANVLSSYDRKTRELNDLLRAEGATADIALREAEESYGTFPGRMPQSYSSNQIKITESVTNPSGLQLEERLRAIGRVRDTLGVFALVRQNAEE